MGITSCPRKVLKNKNPKEAFQIWEDKFQTTVTENKPTIMYAQQQIYYYVGVEYKQGGDIILNLENKNKLFIPQPIEP